MSKSFVVNINNVTKYLKSSFLIIGIILTLWRGYECLQKFYNSNLSTRVNIVSSTETIAPVMVICPDFMKAYKKNMMAKYGLKDRWDYMKYNLQGNDSSIDERTLFEKITNNFTEIVRDLETLLNTGKKYKGIASYYVLEKRF